MRDDQRVSLVSDRVWIAAQIGPETLAAFAKAGVTIIVNNRPDGEEPGQPSGESIAAAARDAGLSYVAAPVRGLPDFATVRTAIDILDSTNREGIALFYCRSGMRSAALWAMAEIARGAQDAETLRDRAAAVGYDLSRLPL